MAFLAVDRNTPTKYKERVILCLADDESVLYAGGLGAWNALGFLVPMSDAANLQVAGRIESFLDMTGAPSDGVLPAAQGGGPARIDVAVGVFSWDVTAGLAAVAVPGMMVYGYDDHTVGLASDTTNDTPVGILEEIDAAGNYWFSTGRRFRDEALGALSLLDTVSATEIDDDAVTLAKLHDLVADKISGAPTVAVAAAVGDDIAVTITCKDAQGNTLAQKQRVSWYLSDAASEGALSADAPDGGTAVTTGRALIEHTAELIGEALTDANGVLVLTLTESGTDAWYLTAMVGPHTVTSAIISFT
jgi:hypothetical protein